MNRQFEKFKNIKSEAFREYSHLQGSEVVNTHEKLRF